MRKQKIEKFGLEAVQTVLNNLGSDIEAARESLAFAIGASVDVSGTVLKLIKRDGRCKLFIAPDNAQLTVFADCSSDVQSVISRKIRKGSKVQVIGKLAAFGFQSVNLTDCRLKP
jgi:hypothetical protein